MAQAQKSCPPKVSDRAKRTLVRKTTKKSLVTLSIILPPPCFTVGMVSSVGFQSNLALYTKLDLKTENLFHFCGLRHAFYQTSNRISYGLHHHLSSVLAILVLYLAVTSTYTVGSSVRATKGKLKVMVAVETLSYPLQ